jgi:DNA-binding transcriptional regulator YdaS (Cro superfamily)
MPEIIQRAGGVTKLAAAVGRHHATILGWHRVPAEHAKAVAEASGIPLHELRPDLWEPPRRAGRPQTEAAE